jgi:hypothetical protein
LLDVVGRYLIQFQITDESAECSEPPLSIAEGTTTGTFLGDVSLNGVGKFHRTPARLKTATFLSVRMSCLA